MQHILQCIFLTGLLVLLPCVPNQDVSVLSVALSASLQVALEEQLEVSELSQSFSLLEDPLDDGSVIHFTFNNKFTNTN